MAKNRIPPPVTFETVDDLVNYQGILPSTLAENQDLYSTERNLPFKKLGKYDTGLTRLSGNQEHYRAENQRGWGLLPTAAGRLIASTITKTLEGVAAMGTGFTENALSKEIADAEKHILNEWFPVYKSQGMESDSLMDRLKEPGWWASTATDGAAFMLSAIIGTKGISALSKLGLVGKLAKGIGASDDILMQMGKLSRSTVGKVLGLEKNGVGAATAYGAFNEAFFESKGVIDQVKNQISKEKYGGDFEYLSPEQQADVMQAAGKAGQETFWANLPVLLLTERIFNETILGSFFGLPEASAFSRIIKEGDQFKLNALSKGQRAALYGLPFAANIPTEMFQENYQLAVENYFTKKATGKSTAGLLEGILGEMGNNFTSIEGKESMFLGGLLGGLGAGASLGNIGKQEKYANQYLDILNGHYGTLNKAASTYFEKDNAGNIVFENGLPKVKSQEAFKQEFDAITNNFEKYQIMSELRTASEMGDTSAKELYDIAVNDRFSETMFQLFQNPESTNLVNTLIDSYAEKYAQEYEEITGEKADKAAKVKELKTKAERMQSLYNLAETYYQVDEQPASLAMQYHSLFKQDYFKQKAKEFRSKADEVLSQLPIEDKLKIEDAINKPNKNSNNIIDAVLDNADFSKMDGVHDKVDAKANVAKALSFQSLYDLERQRFDKEFTKEEFYKKANEKIEEEAKEESEKAKKQAVVDEARRKRAEEIAKQEAAKKAAQPVTPVKPVQTAQPVQPTAPVAPPTPASITSGTTNTSVPEIPGINRETIEDYFKNNDGKAATTIAREIDTPIENVKFWLDKLVEEGKLVKKGNNRYYKVKNVSSEESQVEPDTTDTEAKKAEVKRLEKELFEKSIPLKNWTSVEHNKYVTLLGLRGDVEKRDLLRNLEPSASWQLYAVETLSEEEAKEVLNNVSTDAKADIPIGKVGNTHYEVKSDGVYFKGNKLDNPDNKTHKQLIEADIERRRQEELDNLFSESQAITDKQLNTPVQKLSKEEINRNIETAKQQNKDLIEELENPEFLNDEKRNDEWDEKADELIDKLPRGVSFKITDGKVDLFDNQSYRESNFGGNRITQVSVASLHRQTEKFEVGDRIQVQDGVRALPAEVTKVNENGKILEAKTDDGRTIISKGNIVTTAPINDRLKINAKYDAELKAVESLLSKEQTPTALRDVESTAKVLEKEGLKPTLKNNGDGEMILQVDDIKGEGKRNVGVIGLKMVEVDGKKFLSIGMTSVREGYEGKGLATNMYRYLMENLPEGYDGILSPKETRWNNEQIPKIHEKLAKEYDKTELDNGDIIFKPKLESLLSKEQATSSKPVAVQDQKIAEMQRVHEESVLHGTDGGYRTSAEFTPEHPQWGLKAVHDFRDKVLDKDVHTITEFKEETKPGVTAYHVAVTIVDTKRTLNNGFVAYSIAFNKPTILTDGEIYSVLRQNIEDLYKTRFINKEGRLPEQGNLGANSFSVRNVKKPAFSLIGLGAVQETAIDVDVLEEEVIEVAPINVPTDKQIREQNEHVITNEALSEGHNVLGNRVVQMEKTIEGGIVHRANKDGFLLDKDANTAAMHSNVKVGDKIQMSIPVDFMETPMYIDNKNNETVTFRKHMAKVAPENYRQELIDNLPITISHNGVDLGYVHRVSWINDTNLIEKEFVSFEEQKAQLRAFREQFVDSSNNVLTEATVETEIDFKGPGKLARDTSYKPLSEAVPSFPIAVVTANRTVKTMDGKVITLSHEAIPGQAGFLHGNKFFVAKRKPLNEEDKNTLKDLLLEPVKSVNKIASMVYVSTIADVKKIEASLRNQKTPNNLRLAVNKNSFYIYEKSTGTLYANPIKNGKLDEYLAQELVANIIPSKENQEWASNNLLTNIREIEANYDGNVEPTIFVHNVVRFQLPKKTLSERVVPEVTTEVNEPQDDEYILRKKFGIELFPNVRQEAEDLIKKCKR